MNYQLLKQLLDRVEQFEQQIPDESQQTLINFSAWLRQSAALPTTGPLGTPASTEFRQSTPDTLIGIMATYLYRYARLYGKKALETSELATLDEFVYLTMLLEGPPPTKTELIERNIHEKTTGIEILRRLLANGLVEQFDDPTDRRSKRLKITEKGRTQVFGAMPYMQQVTKLVGGNLTEDEKVQLVHLLNKLHLFHNDLFRNDRSETLPQLLDKLKK